MVLRYHLEKLKKPSSSPARDSKSSEVSCCTLSVTMGFVVVVISSTCPLNYLMFLAPKFYKSIIICDGILYSLWVILSILYSIFYHSFSLIIIPDFYYYFSALPRATTAVSGQQNTKFPWVSVNKCQFYCWLLECQHSHLK